MFSLQRLSIDLSNFCSMECDFCYNKSNRYGKTMWNPPEIIKLVKDCVKNGLQAVSFGGGEPFEYEGIFEIISKLTPHLFVSLTTNGIPLKNKKTWKQLIQNKPDKIHFTIHNPTNRIEIKNALHYIRLLQTEDIKTGVNLLVSNDKITETKQLFNELETIGILRSEIILVPRKFTLQPTPKEVSEVADGKPFQSSSCLINCKRSERFASISWNKQVNFCSFNPDKAILKELSYSGIINALNTISFTSCQPFESKIKPHK